MSWIQRSSRAPGRNATLLRGLALMVLLAPGLARAGAPAAEAVPGMATPGEEAPAVGISAEAILGWGYYELLHVGLSARLGERSAVGILAGSNLGANGKVDWSAGLSYAHAVFQPIREIQLGWKVTGLSWTQSDPDYDWRLLSLLFGVSAERPLAPGLTIGLDLSGVYTYTLASDRKQDTTFSDPQAWNLSLCIELKYRFKRW